MTIAHALRPAQGDRPAEAVPSAEEILRRIYALPAAEQHRTVEFLRGHPHAALRACAKPLEDALARRQLEVTQHDAA